MVFPLGDDNSDRQRLPVVMEASLLNHAKVAINAGQRGTMLAMAPKDILEVLAGSVFDISEP